MGIIKKQNKKKSNKMKVVAICLLALIACTQGLQMYEKYPGLMNFSSKRSIMAVMAQVEATIKNGGPMDAITRILDEYHQKTIKRKECRTHQRPHHQKKRKIRFRYRPRCF